MWITGDRIRPKDQSLKIELVIVGTNSVNYFCKGNHTLERIILEKKQAHIDYEEAKDRSPPGVITNASELARQRTIEARRGKPAVEPQTPRARGRPPGSRNLRPPEDNDW